MQNNVNTNIVLREVISREDAKQRGLRFFFTGKACVHGHVDEWYVSNGNCAACRAIDDAKRITDGRKAESVRRWREAYPDHRAAQKGWAGALGRGAVLPSDFRTANDLITATIGFYQDARSRTDNTGTYYTVDHILPLSRGGQHHPANLRVVTGKFNRAKFNMTDAECLERIMNGTWTGPTDDLTVAVLVRSLDAERRMAGAVAVGASA